MAADKSIKRKPKTKTIEGADEDAAPAVVKNKDEDAAPAVVKKKEVKNLLTRKDARYERRYEPKTSSVAIFAVLAMSLGSVAVGAGTYGQWLRAEALGPHKWAPYLLVAGAIVLLGVALFGQGTAKAVRVGDAGVAVENEPGDLERVEWRDMTKLVLSESALTVETGSGSIDVPLKLHGQAAARVLAELKARMPKLREGVNAGGLEALDDTLGEVLPLDPPQVAGERCAKSNKLIAFEKDARFCRPCGEVYRKEDVPKLCVTCNARLA